jgi:hypothetical protein
MDLCDGMQVHHNVMEESIVGIRGNGASNCVVEYNTFRTPQIGVDMSGQPNTIRNNTFSPPSTYVFAALLIDGGSPVIRDNTFTQGPVLWTRFGASPNMGTVDDAGGNTMSAVTGTVIQHDGTGAVTALGNTWPNEPPLAGDIVITSSGTVETEW